MIPCTAFLICLWKAGKVVKNVQKLRGLLSISLLFGIFFIHLAFIGEIFIERKFPVVSMNAFIRTNADFLVWGSLLNGNLKVRDELPKPSLPENYKPADNIILVIDESVRGDHLSLNGYKRKTTPFLEELQAKGILHNWGIAAASTTASIPSYEMITTGLLPDDLPDKSGRQLRKSPVIFQYAKAMNYTTYFFDGQMNSFWGTPNDINYIDFYISARQIRAQGNPAENWETDNLISKRVNEIISSSTGNFIFIFKRGSHVPYQNNYPKNEEFWKPAYNFSNVFEIPAPEHFEEVVNSYDNSLRFNVDSFFRNLLDGYENLPNRTTILYTADHGQTFFINGRAAHGGTSKEEAIVPLFLISSENIKPDTNYKASHQNILPTVLDLMKFPEELRARKYGLSLLQATAGNNEPRFFNPNCGPKIAFD